MWAAVFDSMAGRAVRANIVEKAEARDFWQHESFIETVYGHSCDKQKATSGGSGKVLAPGSYDNTMRLRGRKNFFLPVAVVQHLFAWQIE